MDTVEIMVWIIFVIIISLLFFAAFGNSKYSESSIEEYMQKNFFKYVIGVHSSVLIFAKQIYGEMSTVISFGMDRVLFKNNELKERLTETYKNLDIVIK